MRQTKAEIMAPVEDHRNAKVIHHNTIRYERSDGTIVYRYHNTDILFVAPDGTITLDSGGWQTFTTRDRYNALFRGDYGNLNGERPMLSRWSLWQERSIWYVAIDHQTYGFADGMRILPDNTVEGTDDVETLKLTNKRIERYVRGFIKALTAGKLSAPSSGDCWFCSMKVVDGKDKGKSLGDASKDRSHLEAHFEESYYVPSLLVNAIKQFSVSPAARHAVGYWLKMHEQRCEPWEGIATQQVRSALRRYLRLRMGLGA